MQPIFFGYHGPRPGTIWFTIQAIYMSAIFLGGAAVITYIALSRADPLCLTGGVVCAILGIMFIIGYIVDMMNYRREQDSKGPKLTPLPSGNEELIK